MLLQNAAETVINCAHLCRFNDVILQNLLHFPGLLQNQMLQYKMNLEKLLQVSPQVTKEYDYNSFPDDNKIK